MSSIRTGRPVSTASDRETIRCFAHVLRDADSQDLADGATASLNNWEIDTFALHIIVEAQPAQSLREAVEHGQQALRLYPESMQLIIGSSVLDGTKLREPLHTTRAEFGRGYLAIIHLGKPAGPVAPVLDGVIRPDSMRSEARRVMRMLYYQRPVPKTEPPCAPHTYRVTDRESFVETLRIRFTVYDLMGYIPDQYRSTRTGLELDSLDKYSLHYACDLPGENNGLPGAALRLITRRRQQDSSRWVKQTVKEHNDRKLRRSTRVAQFQELPVFNAIYPLEEFQALLQSEEAEYCELSRVVVDEACRGMGLSRGLIEFALGDARRLGIRCVFLACVPEQVSMYEKYGFTHFPSDVVTFARVQEPAQAMFQFI